MTASAHTRSSKGSTPVAKPHAHTARTARASTAAARAPRSEEERRALIAEAAYFRAEERGFALGKELDDWLAAESEIDGQRLLADQLAHSDT